MLFQSKSKRTRGTATYKRSSEKEQKRRKIDRCQEGAGLGVMRKMGLIPPPIPAAFLLFEVTSGLNFPFWAEQKGSLLGGWKGGWGLLLPPRLNSTNTVDTWVTGPGTEQTYCILYVQTLTQSSSWWICDDYWNETSNQYQSSRDTCGTDKKIRLFNSCVRCWPLNTTNLRQNIVIGFSTVDDVSNCSVLCWPGENVCIYLWMSFSHGVMRWT